MRLTLLRLTTLGAALALGYPALQQAAPGLAARADALLTRYTGWDEAACQADPTGCLDAKAGQLASLDQRIATSLDALRAEQARVETLMAEQQLLQARNQAFLEQGRALYRAHADETGTPLVFAGRHYPELDTFRLQLELLFREQQQREASITAAGDLQRQLAERLDTLALKRAEIVQQRALIPTRRELLRVDRTFAEIGATIGDIDRVLREARQAATDPVDEALIGTTTELMSRTASRTATPGEGQLESAFQAFLANTDSTRR